MTDAPTQNMVLSLPGDVLSYIFHKLSLAGIGRLRQTCSELNNCISDNKQLWLHILHRDIHPKALPLPRSIRSIEEASAHDVEQWIKNSIILSKNYSCGFNHSVTRARLSMSITWTKLVRGRWCLIACSDLDVSQLVVWDLQNPIEQLQKAIFYLSGPVVDGIIEDNAFEILIAVTIGKRTPSILVLKLFTAQNEVRVSRLFEVPGASHVRLLQRPYIGFAVHDGDDTYPSLMNWENGCSRKFTLPESVHDLPTLKGWTCYFRHEPCNSMFLWRGHVFLVYPYKTVIFGCPLHFGLFDDTVLLNAVYTQAYYMPSACVEMSILQDNGPIDANHRQLALRLAARGAEGDVYLMSARYDESLEQFLFHESYLIRPCVCNQQSRTRILCVGTSARIALLLAINEHHSKPLPCLYTAQINSTESSVEFGSTTPLLTKGMPLLYEITSMDFNDGCGMFIVGTINGEVCVRSFGTTFSPSSLENDLPVLQTPSDLKEKIPIDLPVIYETGNGASHSSEIETLIEAAIQSWSSRVPVPQVSGWSSDWSSFQNIDQWLASFPRWGVLDKFVNGDLTITSRLRMRLGTLGEIIPVLFEESNHFRVIFRVGDRLYYCKSMDSSCEYQYDPEFDMTDYEDVLEILSVTYTQFLNLDATTVGNLISDSWMRHNLDSNESTVTDSATLRQITIFDAMRKSAARQDGEHIVDKAVDEWSEEDMIVVRDFIQRDALKW